MIVDASTGWTVYQTEPGTACPNLPAFLRMGDVSVILYTSPNLRLSVLFFDVSRGTRTPNQFLSTGDIVARRIALDESVSFFIF